MKKMEIQGEGKIVQKS